tara:strand:- start:1496 stop:2047 length:552 start_codon:yes stop_codon:yes gene_type:complete
MQLKLIQKKFTFFQNKYEILQDDQLLFKANSILFTWPKKIEVKSSEGKNLIRISKNLSLKSSYEIQFSSVAKYDIKAQSWVRDYFLLRIPEGELKVYHQRGLRLIILLNEEQVAEITKNSMSFFGGDEFEILANSDFSKELLVALCLVWEMNDFDGKKYTVNINAGNLSNAKKEEHTNWKPTK